MKENIKSNPTIIKSYFLLAALLLILTIIPSFQTVASDIINSVEDDSTNSTGPFIDSSGTYEYYYCEDGTIGIDDILKSAKEIIFPEKLDGNIVTQLYFFGMRTYYGVEKITIPSTVNDINSKMGGYFPDLCEVSVSSDNLYYTSVNSVLFNKDMTELIIYPAMKSESSYLIPDGVRGLSEAAFRKTVNLSEVKFPRSLTFIDNGVWDGFPTFFGSSIESFVVDKQNSSFSSENGVLYNSSGRTLIYYPTGKKDTSFTIPSGVTAIGDFAFDRPRFLENIIIPSSVTSIEDFSFFDCNRNFTIYGTLDSYAEKYAINNNFPFKNISDFSEDKPAQIIIGTKSYKKTYVDSVFLLDAERILGDGEITYSSSDKKVVTVNTEGNVHIVGTGIATITVSAASTQNYSETNMSITIYIIPKKTILKSLTVAEGQKLIIKWNKDPLATGYQIQYSTNKKFTNAKIKKISSNTKTSYSFTKLKINQKYYVRIRSYKESGNKILYGSWSKSKQSDAIKK